MDKCYKCGSKMKEVDTVITMGGKRFSTHTLRCPKCGEEVFDESEVKRIRIQAQRAGVWGYGVKPRRKLQKVGRAMALYIPADIQKQLKLKPKQEVRISIEDNKIIIEPIKRR